MILVSLELGGFPELESWVECRRASGFVNDYRIVEVVILELVAIVRGLWNGWPLSLCKLDGIILKRYEGICGYAVKVIIGEIISIVVTSHSIEPSLEVGYFGTLTCGRVSKY